MSLCITNASACAQIGLCRWHHTLLAEQVRRKTSDILWKVWCWSEFKDNSMLLGEYSDAWWSTDGAATSDLKLSDPEVNQRKRDWSQLWRNDVASYLLRFPENMSAKAGHNVFLDVWISFIRSPVWPSSYPSSQIRFSCCKLSYMWNNPQRYSVV